MSKQDKLIVALDVPDLKSAERVVKVLSPTVKIFKVGKELFTSCGPEVVKMVHSHDAKVFLDLKFHDIPNTVAGACAAAARLGVFMMNVHASGGRDMLKAAVRAIHETALHPKMGEETSPLLLGVTILTSMSDDDLKEIGINDTAPNQVIRLAKLSKLCGLNGVVASGQEIRMIREALGKEFIIVTPGVRPVWAAQGDQKRVVTPAEAIARGADYIVVGRPITESPKPKEAAQKILEEL